METFGSNSFDHKNETDHASADVLNFFSAREKRSKLKVHD